ncbi:hypothetical protein GCM10025867_09000 [Frondihabitans sucicola]|uniref:Uncharacterized protein n=1 Tax=Frondihabitans sucicola TaxID=1268041 RepID=A0ABM8GJV3_9MICO|nr:hypothetical protein [Frondihabitans sucicola]BDZ48659.1 hypothetical protein GCM10025867_09000 [Frondihabitans sucicola]
MRRHTIKIDQDTFVLTDDVRAQEVEAAALLAVQQGGGMVNVFHDDNRNVSVLVSPGVPIFFRSDTVDEDDAGPDWVDLDISFREPDF